MPTEIRSRAQPEKLLHLICYRHEITEERTDLCPAADGLQVACFTLPHGKTFKAHEHIPRPREIPITQETWIVISGVVLVTYYDLDGTQLCQSHLHAGDCSITLAGGHNYQSLEAGSTIYECKLGPFIGVEADKRLLA